MAENYGGMHNLLSCFLLVPENGAGFNSIADSAEAARAEVVDMLNVKNFQVENFSVQLTDSMEPLWTFLVVIDLIDTGGEVYSVHCITFDKDEVLSCEVYDVVSLLRNKSLSVNKLDWSLMESNLLEILQ